MAAITRLGLYGGPRGLYGDFSTKEAGVVISDEFFGAGDDQIMDEDEILLAIIKDFASRL